MDLDRRSIERDDFARARRGYDPEQVRRHLQEIADQAEELQRKHYIASVADSAATQVHAIVEAAERSGAELEVAAREEADRIRADAERIRAEADSEAEEARARSTAEAAERLDLVHAASARVLERAEEIERALGELRDEAMALGVEVGVDAPAGAGTDEEVEPTELVPADAVEPTSDPVPQTVESEAEDLEAEVDEATPEATDTDEPVAEDGGADVEDVRLVALNMALNGSPRDETARYLEENFAIEDPTALLDEVYERAGA